MKILTKEILNKFKKQGYTGDKQAKDIKIILKLFGGPRSSWYLYEYDENTRIFYGYCNPMGDSYMAECGPVSLDELLSIKFPPFGLPIERDMYFGFDHTLEEVMNKVKSGQHV